MATKEVPARQSAPKKMATAAQPATKGQGKVEGGTQIVRVTNKSGKLPFSVGAG